MVLWTALDRLTLVTESQNGPSQSALSLSRDETVPSVWNRATQLREKGRRAPRIEKQKAKKATVPDSWDVALPKRARMPWRGGHGQQCIFPLLLLHPARLCEAQRGNAAVFRAKNAHRLDAPLVWDALGRFFSGPQSAVTLRYSALVNNTPNGTQRVPSPTTSAGPDSE
jgi:hypothetical protein